MPDEIATEIAAAERAVVGWMLQAINLERSEGDCLTIKPFGCDHATRAECVDAVLREYRG